MYVRYQKANTTCAENRIYHFKGGMPQIISVVKRGLTKANPCFKGGFVPETKFYLYTSIYIVIELMIKKSQ